jgi:translation initiation factor 1 (eIF-1/SUI1)
LSPLIAKVASTGGCTRENEIQIGRDQKVKLQRHLRVRGARAAAIKSSRWLNKEQSQMVIRENSK